MSDPVLDPVRDAIVARQKDLNNSRAGLLIKCLEADLLKPFNKDPHQTTVGSYASRLEQALQRYPILAADRESCQLLTHKISHTGLDLLIASTWLENRAWQPRFLLPFRASAFLRLWHGIASTKAIEARRLLQEASNLDNGNPERAAFIDRPFGVNVIGHAFNVFGIGEDARCITAALEAAGIPCCVIDHPADNGSATSDRTLERLTLPSGQAGPYAFNLVCMAAPIHARWVCQEGLRQLLDRYTIVSWPWELERWPETWEPCLELADEAWPFSRLIEGALQPYEGQDGHPQSLHLTRMPAPAEIQDLERFANPKSRLESRHRFSLPAGQVLFVFGFDLNSTISRKNPHAVIEAFQLAFPASDPLANRVALVIKTLRPGWPHPEWEALKAHCREDPRFHVIEADLSRTDLLSLYGCCDGFISLHRSEGLGRGHAEALQLGLDVIVTDYGSTTDFCVGPLAHPVRCRMIPVKEGEYFDHKGQFWADADVHHAAERLREVALRRLESAEPDPTLTTPYRQRFTFTEVGKCYRLRLEELWGQRQDLAPKLKSNRFRR
ncbi:glycosyltransferase [Cyanobium sp. AMD-g]|uniref:glycosyltransferase n=1 Tax=Cyanobium sp. AMD-g TaxID=2823699 RepID=UPI0020CC0F3D|nr:glycosyltransferase [Cyanobium sp. AMD-g]MCP9931023.1 glycosyltransferase [Cyanobium sp. AMD-g]